jgi:serine phosphatase RsbU (regulator of sigma subunit)
MAKQTSSSLEDMAALLSQLQNFQESSQAEWTQVLNQWSNLEAT